MISGELAITGSWAALRFKANACRVTSLETDSKNAPVTEVVWDRAPSFRVSALTTASANRESLKCGSSQLFWSAREEAMQMRASAKHEARRNEVSLRNCPAKQA